MEKKDIKLFYEQSARKTPHSSYYLSKNKGVRWLFNKRAEILDKALAEIVKDLSNLMVLDVGCGDGNLTKKLEKYGNVTALDISIVRLKRLADLMSRGRVMMGDAETLPFKKSSFDLILCSSTLDHLLEPKKAVLEMKRVIKKNGYILLIIDNYLIKTKRNIDALGHFSPLNFWMIKSLISECGLDKYKIYGFGFPFEIFKLALSRFYFLRILSVFGEKFPSISSELTIICKTHQSA